MEQGNNNGVIGKNISTQHCIERHSMNPLALDICLYMYKAPHHGSQMQTCSVQFRPDLLHVWEPGIYSQHTTRNKAEIYNTHSPGGHVAHTDDAATPQPSCLVQSYGSQLLAKSATHCCCILESSTLARLSFPGLGLRHEY